MQLCCCRYCFAAAANNLVAVLDGYFIKGGHHINVNVLNR
jgi:formate C-acetyltransferase